tara:strand:+ start:2202 stop:3134 length:933 start_codon:yes stop_codon:yes gene_type:complete
MKINKPKFWDKKNSIASFILLPFSFAVLIFIFLKRKITQTNKFKIPIVCIGNIYIGGTGKTPASIFLANEILKSGKSPVILRKFYSNQVDECNLIKANFKNLILDKNRTSGIKKAMKNKYDIVILDDGFQDYKLKKDLNIICFNSNQLIGNGLVIPSGPLRERLNALKYAQIVLINGNKNNHFEKKILKINENLNIFYSRYKPTNIEEFKNKKLLAIAGIGNPENFFKLIEDNNLEISKKLIFPDHYSFSLHEIQKIMDKAKKENLNVIMTEKDYYKLNHFQITGIKYLKISLEIENKEKFLSKVKEIYV